MGLEANDSRSNFLESSLDTPFSLVPMHSCTAPLRAGGEGTGKLVRILRIQKCFEENTFQPEDVSEMNLDDSQKTLRC